MSASPAPGGRGSLTRWIPTPSVYERWVTFLDGWDAERHMLPEDANPMMGIRYRALWRRGWRRAHHGLFIEPPRPTGAERWLALPPPID